MSINSTMNINIKFKKVTVNLGVLILFFLPIILGFWYVINFSVNSLYSDLWYTLANWHIKFIEGNFDWHLLFYKYVDSRHTVAILLLLPLSLITNLNMEIVYFCSFILYLIFVFLLIFFLKKDLDINLKEIIILSIPILYYTLNFRFLVRYIHNIGAFTYPLCFIFAMFSFYFLNQIQKGYKSFLYGSIFGILSFLSGIPGLGVWIVGAFQIALQSDNKKIIKLFIWLLLSFIIFFLHFYIFNKPPFTNVQLDSSLNYYFTVVKISLENFHYKIFHLISALGHQISYRSYQVLIFGILFIVLTIFLFILNKNFLKKSNLFKWYSLLFFGLLTTIELVIMRSNDYLYLNTIIKKLIFKPDIRHQPAFFLPFLSLYILSILFYYNAKKMDYLNFNVYRKNKILFLTLFFLLFSTYFINFKKGYVLGIKNVKQMCNLYYITLNYENLPDSEIFKLGPDLNYIKSTLQKLKKYKLNVFTESKSKNRCNYFKIN